jgi:hypothetical protein
MKTKAILILFLVAGIMTISCTRKLKQTDVKLKKIETPFEGKKYFSDKKHYRATGEGIAQDLTVARRIAETNARQGLASQIEVKVRSVGEQYLQNRSINQNIETNTKYEDITRTVIDETLRNIELFDQKSYKDKKGNFVHYVAMQMSTEAVAEGMIEKIRADDKLKQDFELERFRRIYEQELEEFNKEN